MTGIASLSRSYECGTRAAYVSGCRCDRCRQATRDAYRARSAAVKDARAELAPNGPAIESTMVRGGATIRITRCPGTQGRPCVSTPATWLRGQGLLCNACVDRATVWNGLVSPTRAREHLLALSKAKIGYKAVADACDVGKTTLARIISGENTPIRARIERAILSVDLGARADGSLVDASGVNATIGKLRARGFTLRHLARLLGYSSSATFLQLGRLHRCTARTRAKVERLWRRVETGEVRPERAFADASAAVPFLESCFAAGLTAKWLSNAIGVRVYRRERSRMRPAKLAAILGWRDRIRDELTDGLPDGWSLAQASAVADAFSWGGGFSVGRCRARFTTKPKAPKKERPAPLTPEERRERDRKRQAARRQRIGVEAVRAENAKHARASRQRKREWLARLAERGR